MNRYTPCSLSRPLVIARISQFEVAGVLLAKAILLLVGLTLVGGACWSVKKYWDLHHDARASITELTNIELSNQLAILERRRDLLDLAAYNASFRLTNTNLLNGIFGKSLSPTTSYRLLSMKLNAQTEYKQTKVKDADPGKTTPTKLLSYQVEARWRLRGTGDRELVRSYTEEILHNARPDFATNNAFEPWTFLLHTDIAAAPGASVDDEIYDQMIIGTLTPPEGEPYRLRAGKNSEDRWSSLEKFFSEANK